jgi:hypothetical protein
MKNLMSFIKPLARDEEGTAMTEFAIALPIFLLFFGAIIGLGAATHAAIEAHTNAAPPLWQEVYAAEDDTMRMTPRDQVFTGGSPLGPLGSDLMGMGGAALNGYYSAKGHWGESRLHTQVAMPLLTGKSLNAGAQGQEMTSNLTDNPRTIIGDSRAAMGVADDTLDVTINWTNLGGGIGGVITELVNNVTAALGVNLGYGAGIRYGTVEVGHSTSAQMPYGLPSVSYNVGYSSLISPSPESNSTFDNFMPFGWTDDPEDRAWVAARLWVETEPQYRNLFAIYGNNNNNRLNRHKSNDVPVIYDDFGTNPDNPWWCIWCD